MVAAARRTASTLVGVDAGTTNLRVWLLDGDRILARREVPVGARDTARDGSDARLRAALRTAVAGLLRERPGDVPPPACIAAAGMITSAQGLLEIPHVVAPAGLDEIAAAAREQAFPDVAELPFVLVPGVKTNAPPGAGRGETADVMRGEETLCLGLVHGGPQQAGGLLGGPQQTGGLLGGPQQAGGLLGGPQQAGGLRQGRLAPGEALLNLGSHWKLIHIDAAGRIARSVTSLAGEMVQAVRTQTILASALPEGPLHDLDVAFLAAGMAEARRSGLPRALFGVRLRELAGEGTPAARLSFLLGAFIASDLDGLRASGALPPGTALTLSGDEKVGGAWAAALRQEGHAARCLTAAEVEAGFLAGLRAVIEVRERGAA